MQQVGYNINIETKERENKKGCLKMVKSFEEAQRESMELDLKMERVMKSIGYKDLEEAFRDAGEFLELTGEDN